MGCATACILPWVRSMIQMFFAGFAVNESLNLDPHPHWMDQNQKPRCCFPQGLMAFLSGSEAGPGVLVKGSCLSSP